MIQDAFWGILIPFLGTSLGAGCVFFLKNSLCDGIQRALTGFAAGVMVAASVWSLLIPAMEQAADLGRLAFFPAAAGFWLGILFLLLLDHLIPHLHQNSLQAEGPKSQLQRTTMMVLAVTLHNIPEGMAVGVVYAGYLAGTAQITAAGALALSLGIAIQNFPEGAIISMPLRAEGMKKGRAFWGGVLSGIVEPIGAVLTILAAGIVVPALPYLLSFAAGVMVAASVWSLLIPAMEQAADLGRLAFFPAAVGFWLGILFLLLLDHLIPHLHQNSLQAEGPKSQLQRTTMLVLAVTLHNIPEGMAVGVVYAGYLAGTAQITAAGALALSLGIAIQNFPEGAIISMPLRAEGMKKGRAFWGGVLSGIVEPIGAVLTILAAGIVVPALPYLLSFAAGAMLYVVVEELIPEMSQGQHSNVGTVFFAVGFSVMMVLDVALG